MEISKELQSDHYINQTNDSESSLILKALQSLIKKWWIFLLVGLAGGILGFIYASRQKPVYESYLSFALDEGGSEGGMSAALGLAAQFGLSMGGAKDVFTGDNILEIMLSRRVVERTLLSVDTIDNKPVVLLDYFLQTQGGSKGKKPQIRFLPGEFAANFSYSKDSLLYKTYLYLKTNNITARRPNKKLNIYEVSVKSESEQFSKLFTDELIQVTNNFYTEISSKKSRETLAILEGRVPEMKGKLNATISNKAAIQDANLNPAFAAAQVPLLKEQVNTQVYSTAYAEMFKNLEMARFQYLKSIPLMQVIDAADYPMKETKVGKLKSAVIFAVLAGFLFFMGFIGFRIISYKVKPGRDA